MKGLTHRTKDGQHIYPKEMFGRPVIPADQYNSWKESSFGVYCRDFVFVFHNEDDVVRLPDGVSNRFYPDCPINNIDMDLSKYDIVVLLDNGMPKQRRPD